MSRATHPRPPTRSSSRCPAPAPPVVHATANASDADGDVARDLVGLRRRRCRDPTPPRDVRVRHPGAVRRPAARQRRARRPLRPGVRDHGPGAGGPTDRTPRRRRRASRDRRARPRPDRASLRSASPSRRRSPPPAPLHSYSAGLDVYPDPDRRGGPGPPSWRDLHLADASPATKPSALYHSAVHVHERACASTDRRRALPLRHTQPFAEANEIWPLFTSDATGASGPVEVTKALRAGPQAVSLVVHDPDIAARRSAAPTWRPHCRPRLRWSFGDGTTAPAPTPTTPTRPPAPTPPRSRSRTAPAPTPATSR